MPTFDEVPLANLHFDPANPRFPKSVDGDEIDSVLKFMLKDANLVDLMRSIGSQGFFPGEPLLVSPHASEDDHWIVVEGNRRLAATILLRNPEAATTRKTTVASVAKGAITPTALPCLKFATRPEILKHLGYRHVTGIKEWDPLAKARYLRERYAETSGDQADRFKEVSRTIGSRSDYVGRLLTALAIYEHIEERKFYSIPGLNESSLDFSLLSSVLAYEKIVRFLGIPTAQSADVPGLKAKALKDLTGWMFRKTKPRDKTVLGESRNIRVLADVVSHPKSLRALRDGATLQLAAKLGGAAGDSFNAAVGSAAENVSLARNYVDDLEEVDDFHLASVGDLLISVRELRSALQDREEVDS